MSNRFSRLVLGLSVVAAVLVMANLSWAIRNELPPSKDNWKVDYDVAVDDAGGDKVTVVFTLADEGRLKPFDSIDMIAMSRQVDNQGGRSYDMQTPIEMKPTKDGKRVGKVEVRKELLDRAKIRIITHMVDGRRQPSGGAVFNIPVAKYIDKSPVAANPKVTK